MAYYKTLHLDREPFSNSPDPGLFYHSRQHLEALQQLEIAVRLKRGLNIITGDVGTGKTTISRQLIQRLSADSGIDCYLMLDPGFNESGEFLSAILKLFDQDLLPSGSDEHTLKEEIKNLLFGRAVDSGRVQVLVIDEGQKICASCLELLRELLNYETNDVKLLQIVIFAQKEFNTLLSRMDNVTDRINFRYTLDPLGFEETKELIRFRLAGSGRDTASEPIFSFPAYFAIFLYSKGYPRKIIHLCHHTLLALIVDERKTAGFFFVRRCAVGLFKPARKNGIGYLPIAMAIVILALSGYFFYFPDLSRTLAKNKAVVQEKPNVELPVSSVPDTTAPRLTSDPAPVFDTDTAPAVESGQNKTVTPVQIPKPQPERLILGNLPMPRNATLYKMIEYIYGEFDPDYLKAVIQYNPKIGDPRFLQTGAKITIPFIKTRINQWTDTQYCIIISEHESLDQAYFAARQYNNEKISTQIISSPDKKMNGRYKVAVNKAFADFDSASAFLTGQAILKDAVCTTAASAIGSHKSLVRTAD